MTARSLADLGPIPDGYGEPDPATADAFDRLVEPDPPPHPAEADDRSAGPLPDRTESEVAPDAMFEVDESLHPIDLTDVLDGTSVQPVQDQLTRDDGRSLFYSGSVDGIHADSGIGKGWVICLLVLQNARRGRRTMLLDLEDVAASIVSRLRLLGMSDHEILTWFVYVRPQVPFGPGAVDHLCRLAVDRHVQAIVIDSIGEAFALAGVDENKDAEVGPWLRMVTRPLADTGAGVVIVDHATKSNDNPLHPSGSKRKRAAITGASYLVEAIDPLVKRQGGRLRLTCAKDRHGNYRRGERVADLVMTSTDSRVQLALYAPSVAAQADATVPTILAARAAVAAAKDAGRTVTQNELVGLMAIKAGNSTKRGGIDHATALGALAETAGARNSRLFTFVAELEDSCA